MLLAHSLSWDIDALIVGEFQEHFQVTEFADKEIPLCLLVQNLDVYGFTLNNGKIRLYTSYGCRHHDLNFPQTPYRYH
jgi:hypothetical protein